jgi:hypothetical protein
MPALQANAHSYVISEAFASCVMITISASAFWMAISIAFRYSSPALILESAQTLNPSLSSLRSAHRGGAAPQDSGSWEGSGTEPILYNYGLWEGGSVLDPPPNLPASAVITDVCFTFNYTYPHPSSGIWILVDDQVGYWENTTGNEIGCSTADNGQTADQDFQGYFGSPGGGNGIYPAINPPATPGGLYTITVSWSS